MFPKDYNFTNSIQSTATATNSQHKVGRSFAFDYRTHRFVFKDGRNVEDTQIEAIKQWIELFIRTELKKYMIYSDSFGLDLRHLLGYRLPRAYQVSEVKRRITEGIMNKVPCVAVVKDWNFNAGIFYFTVIANTGEEVRIDYELGI